MIGAFRLSDAQAGLAKDLFGGLPVKTGAPGPRAVEAVGHVGGSSGGRVRCSSA